MVLNEFANHQYMLLMMVMSLSRAGMVYDTWGICFDFNVRTQLLVTVFQRACKRHNYPMPVTFGNYGFFDGERD